MTINGFEVEKYNVFGIKERATTSICPECSHNRKKSTEKCMSVFWDTGLGQCNHCGARVQLHTYKPKQSYKNYVTPVEVVKSEISQKVLKFFKDNRGISEGTLNHLKIRDGKEWMPKAGKEIDVIEFRYYLHGKLVNIKFRGANKDFKFIKDAKIIPYNIDSIIGSNIAYIVEGEIDCCSVVESGIYTVISVPNGFTLPKKDGTSTVNLEYLDDFIDLFDKCQVIVLATDNDEAGRNGRDELIRRLGSDKCHLVDFQDCKDANEYLLKYGKDKLKSTLLNYYPIPLENVETIYDTRDQLFDMWKNGMRRGYTVGLREMDKNCSFVNSQYTLLLASPSSGKSDKIDDICIRLNLRYGMRVAFASKETSSLFHHNKWVRRILGRKPSIEDFGKDDLINTIEYINGNFFSVVDTGDLKNTLSKFRELYRRFGVKLFVIDPFNRTRLKESNRSDVNEYTEQYHHELDKFVKETDSHLFLVLHPTKMVKKQGSKFTIEMPSAYNAKGGGEHYDMSYNILGMVRDYDRNVVVFNTLKWKFDHLGTTGVEWEEAWNVNNGRYTNLKEGFEASEGLSLDAEWDNRCWIEEEEEEIEQPKKVIDNISLFEEEGVPKTIDINEINF
jgi:twinkle protein